MFQADAVHVERGLHEAASRSPPSFSLSLFQPNRSQSPNRTPCPPLPLPTEISESPRGTSSTRDMVRALQKKFLRFLFAFVFLCVLFCASWWSRRHWDVLLNALMPYCSIYMCVSSCTMLVPPSFLSPLLKLALQTSQRSSSAWRQRLSLEWWVGWLGLSLGPYLPFPIPLSLPLIPSHLTLLLPSSPPLPLLPRNLIRVAHTILKRAEPQDSWKPS